MKNLTNTANVAEREKCQDSKGINCANCCTNCRQLVPGGEIFLTTSQNNSWLQEGFLKRRNSTEAVFMGEMFKRNKETPAILRGEMFERNRRNSSSLQGGDV